MDANIKKSNNKFISYKSELNIISENNKRFDYIKN